MKSRPKAIPRGDDACDPAGLAEAVDLLRSDAVFLAELAGLYREVDAEIQRAGHTCFGGGTCCKFAVISHHLFLSTGELAFLTQQAAPAAPGPLRCPYQLGPRCTARARRPLGCRVFFCRPESQDWCERMYESYHERLRGVHERRRVPYHYVELTRSLAEIRRT